jgi:hypothetical protein
MHQMARTDEVVKERDAALARAERAEGRVFELEDALRLIAAPMRSDGTYNRCREACGIVARAALGEGARE